MTITPNQVGDLPQQPFTYQDTYIPDQLIADAKLLVSQPGVLSAGTLPRGSVLGMVNNSAVEIVAGANTGNGTVGAVSVGTAGTTGAFTLKATSATNFTVTDPEGNALPAATVGTPYANAEINFTITAGGTAFVAGDSFTVTLPDAIGTYKLSVATASDGSQNPSAILADAADASGGPVTIGLYVAGEFNQNSLNYDASWTLPALRAALRSQTIFVKSAVSAADPS
jgi:hypothetical protein